MKPPVRTLLVVRLMALGVAAGWLGACAVIAPPPPPNPFAGTWTTAERQQIAFRDNTVVINQANAPPTAMSAASCDGAFRFAYHHESREALLGLAPRQPDLRQKLVALLVRPDYPVAELSCGEGSSTYVLLDDRTLIAIHRDRDIAGVERLSRL
ncbi:MAG TPA: hypothetical protein VNF04_02135 [Stellaceae bacterium]|nr:hypothetical protein [Stellaceae bacterium]